MKKNFFYLLAMTLFMGLFAACSQEETPDMKTGKSKQVSVSAQLPAEFAQTRALPQANGHKLRCILEVWSQEATPALIYRNEKLSTDATGDKLSFEFNLEAGTYDCRMWADFIDASATLADGRYTDKYYHTADLTKVTIKDASLLYNSDACDAFFASQELVKEDIQEMQSFDATLKRPLAKLIVSDKSKVNFALCKKVSVSHKVPASFNVAEGTTSIETVKADLTDVAPIGTGDKDLRLFSCYAFADTDGALKEISLTFKKENGEELRSTAIPAGVAFQRNHRTQAKGYLIAKATDNTQVEVGVDDNWEAEVDKDPVEPVDPSPETEDPKVGSFYYADGTWSEVLNEEKTCVGIVFAIGAGKGDNVANYGNKLTKINGYVMALKNTSKLNLYSTATIPNVASLNTTTDEYMGYANTSIFQSRSDYAAEENFKIVKAMANEFANLDKTSGWYIPSGAQIVDILSTNYSTTDNAFKSAFALLIEKGTATAFEVAHSSNTTGYISSTVNSAGNAYRITLDNIAHGVTPKFGKASDTGFVRPIFTF